MTGFEFTNPHVRIYSDTQDEKGNVKHWSGEMANPAQYIRAGWGKLERKGTVDAGVILSEAKDPVI